MSGTQTDPNATAGGTPTTEPTTTTQTDPNATAGGTPTNTAPAKTYTQEEYDAAMAETQRVASSQYSAGLTAAMKKAGYDLPKGEDPKNHVAKFQAWLQSQMPDTEKLAATEAELAAQAERAEKAERQLAASKKGIPEEKLEQYSALTAAYMKSDGSVTFETALDLALKDFPISQTTAKPASGVPTFSATPPAETNVGTGTKFNDMIRLAAKGGTIGGE